MESIITPKKILVLGATGGTGREVVTQALDLGHEVTVFVRDPARLAVRTDRVKVVTGSVPDGGPVLAGAVRGQDVVISALGVGNSFDPRGLITLSVPAILEAMNGAGVRRLIFTSAYGVGSTWVDVPFIPRIFMKTMLRRLYTDKETGEAVLRRSDLDWTLVQPTALTNKPKTGGCRDGEHLSLSGFPTISRADVAAFILRQMEDTTYVRKSVLISE